jgi:hypothetical protein
MYCSTTHKSQALQYCSTTQNHKHYTTVQLRITSTTLQYNYRHKHCTTVQLSSQALYYSTTIVTSTVLQYNYRHKHCTTVQLSSQALYCNCCNIPRAFVGVPSFLKDPSGVRREWHFPHACFATSIELEWRPNSTPQEVLEHCQRNLWWDVRGGV